MDGVIPVWASIMSLEIQTFHHVLGDFEAFSIDFLDEESRHFQSGLGSCATNISPHDFEGSQGLAYPIRTDRSKQSMFNRVPLGSAGWVVANRNVQD